MHAAPQQRRYIDLPDASYLPGAQLDWEQSICWGSASEASAVAEEEDSDSTAGVAHCCDQQFIMAASTHEIILTHILKLA